MAPIPTLIACFAVVILLGSYNTEATIGINWGRQSAQRLLPSQVVDLLLQNGIGRARVYTSQPDILAAFAGSGINITVSADVSMFATIESTNAWLDNIMDYVFASNIRDVYIRAFPLSNITSKASRTSAVNAVRLIQTALNQRRLGHQVKAHLLTWEVPLKHNLTKPSECEFLDEVKEEMIDYLQFLQENDAYFPIEIFPLKDALELNMFDLSFALQDDSSKTIINDINGAVYTNIFEWQYDCFVWALQKLNASDIKIFVSQVGWPTDGYPEGTIENAERFYKYLLPLVTSNKGTPMRPGAPIDINVHALTDENKNSQDPYSRHWGIYRSNGAPKFKIDFSGQGRDIYPTTVKGIMRMPSRWCVFNGDQSDMEKVNYWFNWACNQTDCSSLIAGSSCSNLNAQQNVSYAFNMYFQYRFQEEINCNFGGLGYITVEDPSSERCVFPIEVVKGHQINFNTTDPNQGFHRRPSLALFLIWISVLCEIFIFL